MLRNRPITALFVMTLLCATALARPQEPSEDRLFILRGLTLAGASDGRTTDIVVRDGVVEAVGTDLEAPVGATIIELEGRRVLPGLLDAYAHLDSVAARPRRGRGAPEAPAPTPRAGGGSGQSSEKLTSVDDNTENRDFARSGVHPERRAVESLNLEAKGAIDLLKAGITRRFVVPSRGMVSGLGSLISTGPGSADERIVNPELGLHLGFRRARGGYPSTLIGTVAQLRQVFVDARRHGDWSREFAAHPKGLKRPPYRPDLERVYDALMGKIRIFFWCATANDARRALVLGGEFGFSPCIAGAWNIGAAAEELAAARAEVILSIGVPKPKYEENNDLVGKPKDKKKKKKEGESAKGKPAGDRRRIRGRETGGRGRRSKGRTREGRAESVRPRPEALPGPRANQGRGQGAQGTREAPSRAGKARRRRGAPAFLHRLSREGRRPDPGRASGGRKRSRSRDRAGRPHRFGSTRGGDR